MAIKSYVEPRPAPLSIIPVHKPRDPSAPKIVEERVFDGPTLEDWVKAGYDPARYPGTDAFMRKKMHVNVDQMVDEKAITGEHNPAAEVEPAHAITDDEHVTVE